MSAETKNSINFVILDELKDQTLEEIYEKVQKMYHEGAGTAEDVKRMGPSVVVLNPIFF